jgi:hypothetical protein
MATGAGSAGHRLGRQPGLRRPARRRHRHLANLAQQIIRDGEGATKFITITVEQGRDIEECRKIAYSIAHSPLVKTAFFASDPNLGRILAAIGYAGVDDLDTTRLDLYLDDVLVAKAGGRNPDYQEEDGQRVMKQAEILVRVELGRGDAAATVWTCDLSHDYVSSTPTTAPNTCDEPARTVPAPRREPAGAGRGVLPPACRASRTGSAASPSAGAAPGAGANAGKLPAAGAACIDHPLDDLQHVGRQKGQIEQNTRQFVARRPANNVLLTGARGTGKSS